MGSAKVLKRKAEKNLQLVKKPKNLFAVEGKPVFQIMKRDQYGLDINSI